MTTAYRNETWEPPFINEDSWQATAIDLEEVNELWKGMTRQQRVEWTDQTFKSSVFGMSSGGRGAEVFLDHLPPHIPIVHIRTGFQPREVETRMPYLQSIYGFTLHTFGPSEAEIADIKDARLWETDEEAYRRITKINPAARAIAELGIGVLLSGIRAHQTDLRATMDFMTRGQNGELRGHPCLDMSEAEVKIYVKQRGLSPDPLVRLDDVPLMNGGEKAECGLHGNPNWAHNTI